MVEQFAPLGGVRRHQKALVENPVLAKPRRLRQRLGVQPHMGLVDHAVGAVQRQHRLGDVEGPTRQLDQLVQRGIGRGLEPAQSLQVLPALQRHTASTSSDTEIGNLCL
jgi:hypothetical protein